MTRRWVCPKCGAGTNGPERPRRDDVRRYCLDCSAETGRLVERVAPALERQRAQAREKSAAKTTRKRETAREKAIAQRSIGGFDLLAEAKRIWNLPTMKELHRGKELPPIEWRRSPTKFRTSGHCDYYSRRIVITIGTDAADAIETVEHELMHAVVGDEGHSARYWSLVRSVAKEAWPDAPFNFADAPTRGWALSRYIAAGIRATLPTPDPQPPA